ncbi:hypothetical protein [Phenylobacterium sp.]|jgi:uncharacterized membrane protein|uniref:COG3650 family protein n=1 Tax=Phenylobacterium sp. TaxID=1871053 RepID=UPI002F94C9F8
MRAVLALSALALAACSPRTPQGAAAPAPAEAPPVAVKTVAPGEARAIGSTDFSQPMLARGNEPFWAVRMDGVKLTLQRPEQPELVFEAPGATISPGKGVWQARSADGQTLSLTLYGSECNDGMSDIRYPLVAEVEFAGETLRGCAAKQADLARERPR